MYDWWLYYIQVCQFQIPANVSFGWLIWVIITQRSSTCASPVIANPKYLSWKMQLCNQSPQRQRRNYFFFWQDLWGLYCEECDEPQGAQNSASAPASQTTDSSTAQDVFLQAFKEATILVKGMSPHHCRQLPKTMLSHLKSTVLLQLHSATMQDHFLLYNYIVQIFYGVVFYCWTDAHFIF